MFDVVLIDDNEHTYEYVIDMLVRLFGKLEQEALLHAVEVDRTGRTCVLTADWKRAESARLGILSQGKDPRLENSKGPMRALVQPSRT